MSDSTTPPATPDTSAGDCWQLARDLAAVPLESELVGDYPDNAFNATLDEYISRARALLIANGGREPARR